MPNIKKIFKDLNLDTTKVPIKSRKELKKHLAKAILDISDKNWHRYISGRFCSMTGYSVQEIKLIVESNSQIKLLWELLSKKFHYYEASAIKKQNFKDETPSNDMDDYSFGKNVLNDSYNFEDEEINFKEFEVKPQKQDDWEHYEGKNNGKR